LHPEAAAQKNLISILMLMRTHPLPILGICCIQYSFRKKQLIFNAAPSTKIRPKLPASSARHCLPPLAAHNHRFHKFFRSLASVISDQWSNHEEISVAVKPKSSSSPSFFLFRCHKITKSCVCPVATAPPESREGHRKEIRRKQR
jgi:hypothetical protein